jgi:hypothetical protein
VAQVQFSPSKLVGYETTNPLFPNVVSKKCEDRLGAFLYKGYKSFRLKVLLG